MRFLLQQFALFLTACVAFGAEFSQREQHEILEAVFRYQLDSFKVHKRAKVFFLSLAERNTDPSDSFIERFAQHSPKVKKVSESRRGDRGFVFDKSSGDPGLILIAQPPLRTSDSQIVVLGGFYEAGLSGADVSYTLKKLDGKWKVTGSTVTSVF